MSEQTTVETTAENDDTARVIEELEGAAGSINEAGDFVPEPAAIDEGPGDDGQTIPTAELVAPLVGLLCATVAPAWNISPEEQQQLSGAYAAVIDKYFPDGVPLGPEVGAVMVTAAIVMPRLGQPLKVEKEATPEGEKEADGDQS